MKWTQIFRENLNCYALSIFRVFILLAPSDSDKHMLVRQKCKQRFAYTVNISKELNAYPKYVDTFVLVRSQQHRGLSRISL